MGTGGDQDEDWSVACSDDELYGKDEWEPEPAEIKDLYERLAKGETLTLEWQVPERRSPHEDASGEEMEQEDEAPSEEKPEAMAPTEFDFDDDMSVSGAAITPRRTPGSKTPRRTEKRVARMDKIMSDLMRHKRIDKQAKQQIQLQKQNQMTPHRPLQQSIAPQQLTTPKQLTATTQASPQSLPSTPTAASPQQPAMQLQSTPAQQPPATPTGITVLQPQPATTQAQPATTPPPPQASTTPPQQSSTPEQLAVVSQPVSLPQITPTLPPAMPSQSSVISARPPIKSEDGTPQQNVTNQAQVTPPPAPLPVQESSEKPSSATEQLSVPVTSVQTVPIKTESEPLAAGASEETQAQLAPPTAEQPKDTKPTEEVPKPPEPEEKPQQPQTQQPQTKPDLPQEPISHTDIPSQPSELPTTTRAVSDDPPKDNNPTDADKTVTPSQAEPPPPSCIKEEPDTPPSRPAVKLTIRKDLIS